MTADIIQAQNDGGDIILRAKMTVKASFCIVILGEYALLSHNWQVMSDIYQFRAEGAELFLLIEAVF